MKKLIGGLVLGALGFSSLASASAVSFDLTHPDSRQHINANNSSYAAKNLYSEQGIGLDVTGLSNDTNGTVRRDWLGTFGGGLGVEMGSSPQHAIDNNGGHDFDMVLLTFDRAVTLETISIGWFHTDSDVSILAETGTQQPLATTWGAFLNNGWESAGDKINPGANTVGVNSSNLTASRWLIGAYNPIFGGSTSITHDNDAIKLSGISVTAAPVTQATEPRTLGMMALGLLALFATRRRAGDFG